MKRLHFREGFVGRISQSRVPKGQKPQIAQFFDVHEAAPRDAQRADGKPTKVFSIRASGATGRRSVACPIGSDPPVLLGWRWVEDRRRPAARAEAWDAAAKILQSLPIEFQPATRELADVAAGYKARFKLSLADAFAAALAKEMKAEFVIGDPEYKALEKEIKIGWLK